MRKHLVPAFVALVTFLGLTALPAAAQEINLRNANFYLEHTDLKVQKPGAPLEMTRAYNSRSNENGLFGWGWVTHYDSVVRVHADGSILAVDHDGFILRFTHQGRPRSEIRAELVSRLVKTRREDDRAHGNELEDAWYREYEQLLLTDADEREQATWRYEEAWVEPPDGTYRTQERGSERLVKKGGTYTRYRADGLIETYDEQGRLVERKDPAGHGLRLDYNREERLYKVSHTDGASFTLVYDDSGHVVELRDTEGRTATYTYNGEDLVQVKGPGSRVVAYAYDDLHNLVAVRQPDGGGVQVLYDTEHDWAVALKRGEKVTRYDWELHDKSGDHYTCQITYPDGSTERHEYNDEDRVVETRDAEGNVTRTFYSACCDKPVEIQHPDGTSTQYEYDDQGRLVGVTRPSGLTARYRYHDEYNRILQAAFSDGRRYTYDYDESGRIVNVEEKGGRTLSLEYGRNGKVSEIHASDGGTYAFEYDADGRPVRITGRKNVALELSYNAAGQMTGSEISTPSTTRKRTFYKELKQILHMLEPATGSF